VWEKLLLEGYAAKPSFRNLVYGLRSFAQPFLASAPDGLKWDNTARMWILE
jgi:hypothetical protein